ncbi:MAG: NAD(P)/FAD-dependent oxidoreductase, partial [Propionibacteriaceae bacterium]|nr:NAD(P)/FAD-dependent oxidoreductase [Propionibacteriaceae bacterium]
DHVAVIGGGAIGVEFAGLFSALGAEVTVIESLDEILPFMDSDLAAKLRESMRSVTFKLGFRVKRIDGGVVCCVAPDGTREDIEADVIFMAVGRQPCFEGWGAETSDLDITPRGVTVDDTMRTNLPGVWAVGDITGRSQLAHAAYRMGEIAAALIIDPASQRHGQIMRWDNVPWAVYTSPEAAGVGLTEKECAKRGLDVAAAVVPLVLSGRFVAEHGLSQDGAVKIVAEKGSRAVKGIHMVGPYASEAIWGAAGVIEMELTADDLRQVVFPHPTVSEGIREAAWALEG